MTRRIPSPQEGCDRECGGVHVRVDPAGMRALSPRIRDALVALKTALAADPGITHAQVTLDDVGVRDTPPTLDVIATWYHWEPGQTRPPKHPGSDGDGERHLRPVE